MPRIEKKLMCKKIRELNGLTAEEILLLYGDDSYPVDIEKILDRLGIKHDAYDFSDVEQQIPSVVEKRGNILGAVTILNDDVNILYSKNSTSNRMRFTLAHELAHCCLHAESLENKGHVEFRFDGALMSYKEKAANVFAGKLLIPESALMKLYKSLIVPASDVIAREFGVSTTVMEARMEYLNLDFYSPRKNANTSEEGNG